MAAALLAITAAAIAALLAGTPATVAADEPTGEPTGAASGGEPAAGADGQTAAPAGADAALVDRVAGSTRIGTAVELSRATHEQADAVVLARADRYPDALAGAPLAASLDAPILLTPSAALHEQAAAEIDRLGASTAVLLGGHAALSAQIEADLAARGVDVDRLAGSDRFDTARLVAERVGGDDGVYIVEGAHADEDARGWPDAVSASGLAAHQQRPILLVTHGTLPPATADALRSLDPDVATVVGGTAAVSEAVADDVAARVADSERLAGATRYATSRAVADRAAGAGIDARHTWLVSGLNWPDALVAGPAAAQAQAALLLVDRDTLDHARPVRDWLLQWRGSESRARLGGGTAAVSETVEAQVRDLLLVAAAEEPAVEVTASDNTGLSGTVTFPAPRLREVHVDDEVYTEAVVSGIDPGLGEPGAPGVPSLELLIAVPRGAEVSVQATASVGEAHDDLLLLPGWEQPWDVGEPPDDPEQPRPFLGDPAIEPDEALYTTDARYPTADADVTVVGHHRGMTLAQLTVSSGRHNPVGRGYTAYDAVEFDVAFDGGEGWFVTEQSLSALEPASRLGMQMTLNADVLAHHVTDLPDFGDLEFPCRGEELMILTHPDFAEPAADLSDWKNDKGVPANVWEVGAGTDHDTIEAIAEFIDERYDECAIRPSYVLLLGDPAHVPADEVEGMTYTDWLGNSVVDEFFTDLRYGHVDPPDGVAEGLPDADVELLVPDLLTGRISASHPEEARRAVDKIIAYEQSPPDDPDYYRQATHAAEFQCCRDTVQLIGPAGAAEPHPIPPGVAQRTFIESSELARDILVAEGYEPERIYEATVDPDYAAFDPDPVPQRYHDHTPLPDDLGLGSGFAWDGGTSDVIDAFNDGRFLITHRDHGNETLWGTPSFWTSHVGQLTNADELPVVFSINCSTGAFRTSGRSMAEALLFHDDGGAAGVIAAAGVSPSWPNSALFEGLFRAVWPQGDVEAVGGERHTRLGDMLAAARLSLLEQTSVFGDTSATNIRRQYQLFHVHGDPTMEMWTRQPLTPLQRAFELDVRDGLAHVQYDEEGATLTLWQEDTAGVVSPIGRGVVQDGEVDIAFEVEPDDDLPLQLSASAEDAVDTRLTPRGVQIVAPTQEEPVQVVAGDAFEVTFVTDRAGAYELQHRPSGDDDADWTAFTDAEATGSVEAGTHTREVELLLRDPEEWYDLRVELSDGRLGSWTLEAVEREAVQVEADP